MMGGFRDFFRMLFGWKASGGAPSITPIRLPDGVWDASEPVGVWSADDAVLRWDDSGTDGSWSF